MLTQKAILLFWLLFAEPSFSHAQEPVGRFNRLAANEMSPLMAESPSGQSGVMMLDDGSSIQSADNASRSNDSVETVNSKGKGGEPPRAERMMTESPVAGAVGDGALDAANERLSNEDADNQGMGRESADGERAVPDSDASIEPAPDVKLSKSAARKQQECQMANAAMRAVGVTKNAPLQDYVRRVGQRLVAVAEAGDQVFSFEVLETPQIQAATNACGNIFISTGLMMHLNSEAELAAVLGHEIMHVLKSHDKRRKRRELLKGVLGSATAMVLGGSSYSRNEINRSMRTATDLAFTQYDQNQEFEADNFGAEIMAKAGYSPESVVQVMAMFKALESVEFKQARVEGRSSSLFRSFVTSHPPTPERYDRAVKKARALNVDAKDYRASDEFLEQLDGVNYGPSRATGILRGNRFYHARLGITLALPEGWRQNQVPRGVRFESATGHAAFELSTVRLKKGLTPEILVNEVLGFKVVEGRGLTIDGMPAYIATADRAQTVFGERPIRLIVVFDRRRGLAFVGQGSGQFDLKKLADDAAFIKIGFSLARMKKADFETAKPLRLKVVRASPGTTMASLAAQSDLPNYAEDELRVINGLYPQGEPDSGQLIKVVD
ncbi:MAG: putative Zn-dependent protease [Candidatus Azotimanducaceae bacterium]|jgi:predicted Zn-dependent protease|tara:strand:- start:2455 stop:4281 length:1827 start_codon:yes stop_codon:yes gene_type:complete